MKLTKYYIPYFLTIVFVLLLIQSCDSILNEEPKDRLVPTNSFNTEGDAQAAINAVYDKLVDDGLYGRFTSYLADGGTDDLGLRSGVPNIDLITLIGEYSQDGTNTFIENLWRNHYAAINRANTALDFVPDIEMNESLKNRLLGEARFLRALFYFNLVRFFGDVPLMKESTKSLQNINVERSPSEDVYDLIINDLNQAIESLPDSYGSRDVSKTRATRGAAQTLLSKVHLTIENYDEAARQAGAVISSGNFKLMETWKSVFRLSNEFNDESIFEISFNSSQGVGGVTNLLLLPREYPGGTAFGTFFALSNLTSVYGPEDERGLGGTYLTSPHTDATWGTVTWTRPPEPVVGKWYDDLADNNTTGRSWRQMDNNWYVFRYAEVLLIYAEAVNQGGSAVAGSKYEALNQVRERAGLDEVGGLTQEEFTDTLRAERRRELVLEGKRWFDLKRWGILIDRIRETKNPDIDPERTLFPIPQREMDANPALTQNPGY